MPILKTFKSFVFLYTYIYMKYSFLNIPHIFTKLYIRVEYNYLRISVSWFCVVRGRGCLIRSRHCRMSMTIMPIRIRQTTSPTMIKINCQSTGINAKRHAWLKSRSPDEENDDALLINVSHFRLKNWHKWQQHIILDIFYITTIDPRVLFGIFKGIIKDKG